MKRRLREWKHGMLAMISAAAADDRDE